MTVRRFLGHWRYTLLCVLIAAAVGTWGWGERSLSDRQDRDAKLRSADNAALILRVQRAEQRALSESFKTTCDRQNQNRKAIRNQGEDSARALGAYIVQLSPPEDHAKALTFAARLVTIAQETGQRNAAPVDCTYPPVPHGPRR